jgi:hypothetical protein
VLIAPKLDREFRSAPDALKVVEDLRTRGVSTEGSTACFVWTSTAGQARSKPSS